MIEFTTDLALWQLALLSLLSLAVGVLGGFVGLALGTMRLPALLLMGVNPQFAAGTNILVSALSAMAGGYRHVTEGRIDWGVVLWLGVPSIIGGFAGGFFGGNFPAGLLIAVAGVLVLWQGVEFFGLSRRLAFEGEDGKSGEPSEGEAGLTKASGSVAGAGGAAIGLLGGGVGLILGSLRLPLMIRILKIDPRRAAGSNLVVGAVLGIFGFIGHGIHGEVDLPLLLAMGFTGMIGSNIGARYTGRVSVRSLVLVLAWVLLVVGVILVVRGGRDLFG